MKYKSHYIKGKGFPQGLHSSVNDPLRLPFTNREIPGGINLSGNANLCVLRHHSLASRNRQRENSSLQVHANGKAL